MNRSKRLNALPIFCSLFMALLLLVWARFASPEISRAAYLTVYAPLFWICIYFRNPWIIASILFTPIAIFFVIEGSIPFLEPFVWNAFPRPAANIRQWSEVVSFSWTILLAIHCAWLRGRFEFIRYFGVAFVYGLSLESGGIRMGYFSEPGYTFYFPYLSTPIVAVTGWLSVFYPVMFLIEDLQKRWPRLLDFPTLCGILCGMAALSIDIHLDPIATNLGLWIWNPHLTPFFQNVPLLNFTSWFFAVSTFSIACFWIDLKIKTLWLRQFTLLVLIPAIQAIAGVLNFSTVLVIEGYDAPALDILRNYLAQLLWSR